METEKVIILTGPSAVGKTTLKKKLLEEFQIKLVVIPSYTTRMMRSPKDIQDYIFVSDLEFEDMKAKGEFLESSNHYGSWYGTPKTLYHEYLECGVNPIKDINVDGAFSFKEEFDIDCITVYIAPPSKEELERRYKLRDGEVDSKRIQELDREQELQDSFDYKIVNEDVDQCYLELKKILEKELGSKWLN